MFYPISIFLLSASSVFGGYICVIFLDAAKWSELESAGEEAAPPARCGQSASVCTIKGKEMIAIFGGDLSGSGRGDNELWLYDIDADKWKRVEKFTGEPPCPRWK